MAAPAELRAAGLLLARMGAAIIQVAEAKESGDPSAEREAAKDVFRCIAAAAEMGCFEGAEALAADAMRGVAEDLLAPGLECGSAISVEQLDDLLRRGTD